MQIIGRYFFCIGLFLAVIGCTAVQTNVRQTSAYIGSESGEKASRNLLILAGDEDAGAIYHARTVQTRIGAAISAPLREVGFRVFDHRNLSVRWDSGRRFSDQELLNMAANDIHERVDRLVVFSTFVQTYDANGKTNARIRLGVRSFAIPDGRHLGGSEQTSESLLMLPAICDGFCYMETVGNQASPLAQKLGQDLAQQLVNVVDSYRLEFRGFSREDILTIEQELRRFPGFLAIRTLDADVSNWIVQYDSTAPNTDIVHNLRILINRLEVMGQVEMTRAGFSVWKRSGI